MVRFSRRQFFWASGAGVIAHAGFARAVAAREASRLLDWPAQIYQAPAATPRDRPPVLTSVDIHPRAPVFAAAGDDHRVYLWDFERREMVAVLRGHTDWVRTVAFSPEGTTLASAGADRQVILWDIATSAAIHTLADPRQVVSRLAWNRAGDRLACVGFDQWLRVYDRRSWSLVWHQEGPCADLRAVCYSPDDRRLAVAGRNGTIRVWQTEQGTIDADYRAHRQRIHALRFSPQGEYLISGGEDRFLHVREIDRAGGIAGKENGESPGFNLPDSGTKILSCVFTGPNQVATGGSDNCVRLWDLRERQQVGHLNGAEGSVAALACRGAHLLGAGFDTKARLWLLADHVARDVAPDVRTSRKP